MDNFPKKPRGTQDIFPERSLLIKKFEEIVCEILEKNNCKPVFFPSFENLNLYTSTLGGEADIVNKEMFVLKDRKERIFALRPEGTAGIARMVCENKLISSKNPLKLYY
jgi:histidyl-tRNA synthetase